MASADLLTVIYWWFSVSILGLCFLPLTWFLFGRFFDKGYAFSKILGLLLVSYLIWLTGGLHLLAFSKTLIWLIIIGLTFLIFFIFKDARKKLTKIKISLLKIFIFEEMLFFTALLAWSLVRGYQPSIQGLEKFMDFGFVNSILRSKFFPPADIWLAGETINYYYFGHLISAVLIKMSGVKPAIGYNLMIATIFALCLSAGFSLGANFLHLAKQFGQLSWVGKIGRLFRQPDRKIIWFGGILTTSLLTLGGNLQPLYWYLTKHNFQGYWYPDATRFIVEKFGAADNTIHEFPIYSFVVADLHGHMINIPNVLLILALITNLFVTVSKKRKTILRFTLLVALSFCLAIAFMSNAWDYPIYLFLAGSTLLLANSIKHYRKPIKIIMQTVYACLVLLMSSLLFSLPFHSNFENIAQGVSLVSFRSPAWMLLVLWGFPLFCSVSFVLLILKTVKLSARRVHRLHRFDLLILTWMAVSWLLILLPEFIYVKDIYIHSHQRANTMFKLTYQAFIIFSLTSTYTVVRILGSHLKNTVKFLFLFPTGLLLAFILFYPTKAIKSYYGLINYQGLDGLPYLQRLYPDDYRAIAWLVNNVEGQPTILEAVGESYTDYARVSANTGLPTVLGWRVHEWLWRGSFDEPSKRTEEVKQLYQSSDIKSAQQLLNRYQVDYIFIGDLERKQYGSISTNIFDQLGQVVFSSGNSKIYRIN